MSLSRTQKQNKNRGVKGSKSLIPPKSQMLFITRDIKCSLFKPKRYHNYLTYMLSIFETLGLQDTYTFAKYIFTYLYIFTHLNVYICLLLITATGIDHTLFIRHLVTESLINSPL